MRARLLCAVVLLLISARSNAADPAAAWRGRKVLPKENAVVKIGKETVDDADFPLPYVVQDVDGPWLWVGNDRKGWILRSQVVTLDEAPAYYTEIIESDRQTAWAYNLRAIAWQHQGELDLAIADFGERLRLDPDAMTYNNRADVWLAKQQFAKAIADCNQALRLDPDFAYAYNNRGLAWIGKREFGKAVADFNQAMRIDPALLEPYNNTAWLLATCGDENFRNGKRAIELATKACELSEWTLPGPLDTIAAAYAEVGKFEMAIKYEKRSIELNSRDADAMKGPKQRLSLYLDRTPYRDE